MAKNPSILINSKASQKGLAAAVKKAIKDLASKKSLKTRTSGPKANWGQSGGWVLDISDPWSQQGGWYLDVNGKKTKASKPPAKVAIKKATSKKKVISVVKALAAVKG